MTIEDYAEVIGLLRATPGVTVRDADSKEATAVYLARNPGLSFVATIGLKVVGCVMSGHDGRRGYLQHLVVLPEYRRQGVGEELTLSCIAALQGSGIEKVHLFVLKTNRLANNYWTSKGWQLREDLNMYSCNSSINENA